MIPRLFVTPDPAVPDRATLDAAGARHLRALHLRPGDRFHAIVGAHAEREAVVDRLSGGAAICRLGEPLADRGRDPLTPRVLAIALADLARLDLVVEKATELGATAIRPYRAARSQQRDVSPARLERWRRIARAACEQCGRTVAPTIAAVATFAEIVDDAADVATLLFAPGGAAAPPAETRAAAARGALVVIGPEGGLDDGESAALAALGAVAIGLGPRILRLETAAIAALAALGVWLDGPGPP